MTSVNHKGKMSVKIRHNGPDDGKVASGKPRCKEYEEEVLSVPAGNTILGVERYGIYACRNDKHHRFKKSLFMTFREPGGTMRRLYKLDDVREMSPVVEDIRSGTCDLAADHKKRIIEFLQDKEASYYDYAAENKTVCFYILDRDHEIRTEAHSAKQAGQGATYYYLADMLDENKRKKLRPASQERAK